MKYHAQQHQDGRWGIYMELQLLATIGCYDTCTEVLECLKSTKKRNPKRIDLLRNSKQTTLAKRSGVLKPKAS